MLYLCIPSSGLKQKKTCDGRLYMCHGARYITYFYCFAVEAGFYSNVVELLPVDPATWVRFPDGTGKIFSLYDNGTNHK